MDKVAVAGANGGFLVLDLPIFPIRLQRIQDVLGLPALQAILLRFHPSVSLIGRNDGLGRRIEVFADISVCIAPGKHLFFLLPTRGEGGAGASNLENQNPLPQSLAGQFHRGGNRFRQGEIVETAACKRTARSPRDAA
ncbi:hypothetical protein AGMMS49545_05690 [Betaproteobacteria bacterium]|nr:hypothetical protein AGMMS49545_05690 [Betaproteobacteria bacterium]